MNNWLLIDYWIIKYEYSNTNMIITLKYLIIILTIIQAHTMIQAFQIMHHY